MNQWSADHLPSPSPAERQCTQSAGSDCGAQRRERVVYLPALTSQLNHTTYLLSVASPRSPDALTLTDISISEPNLPRQQAGLYNVHP